MKSHKLQHSRTLVAFTVVVACIGGLFANTSQASYYPEDEAKLPIFRPFPNDAGREGNRAWRIRYFGPVGIGIDLKRPGMTMEIVNVEKGSPADMTGKLKQGQIIESINGIVLKEIDPRIILGDIITKAEATDGEINLQIKGEGNVLVQIPVMGAYSETWPVNCPKSDKIVRNLADLIGKQEKPSWGSVLFLLSTGEEQDLDVVRKWMNGIETIGGMNWEKGYKGPGLCEYYLRTGDQTVLPVIKKMTEELKDNMYLGGWSGRGKPAAFTYSTGTGQVHASGVHCLTFILMARLCGVDVDDYLLQESLTQFYRFSGRGNVPYGNGAPEAGFRDNGKTSGLAVAMAVAAQLTPNGESSVYAQARDTSAMKAFYATNWFHAAHTGGGMGEIWHHGAMGLMREKRPAAYRSYHDTRRWVMDLSRRHDGSVAIEGMDDRYNRSLTDATDGRDWGTYFALTYTYPRKALQIWGAPRSQWAKYFELPERPWGNAADDAFNSPLPAKMGGQYKLTPEELLNERVESHASLAVILKYQNPNLSKEEVIPYLFHPDADLRAGAMNQVVQREWDEMVLPLLIEDDPRLRHAGLLAITGMFKGRALPADRVTPKMFDLVEGIIENREESWWVTEHAVKALNRAEMDRIARQRDRLLELLDNESDWLQAETIITLCKIATHPDHYEKVLPVIIDKAAAIRVDSSSSSATRAIRAAVESASPEVKKFASPLLSQTYVSIPNELSDPYTGAVMMRGATTIRTRIGSIIGQLPGGEDYLRRTPKTTLKSYISGKDSDMYAYSGEFTPNPKLLGKWAWAVHPTPKKPSEIHQMVTAWLDHKDQKEKDLSRLQNIKDTLVLEDGGKVSQTRYFGGYFWTGDMLVSNNAGEALKMELQTHGGHEFLIIEKGGFGGGPDDDGTAEIPADYHCGFHVYIRQKD